jgi:hypothetical protein
MLPHTEERREFQRLLLDPPMAAMLGAAPVSIMEIGVLGARILHAAPLDMAEGELHFSWNDGNLAMRCGVVRTFSGRDVHGGLQSGVRFLAAVDDSGDRLRQMLAELVVRALESRRGGGDLSADSIVDGDKTVRGADAAYLCYRFENGVWSRRRVFLPEQPASGFTVARSEDSEEIQQLCRVYAASDDEGRRLIRLFAELSVSNALEIPPRSQPAPPEA